MIAIVKTKEIRNKMKNLMLFNLMFAATAFAGGQSIEMYQTCEGGDFRKVDTFIPFSPHRAVSVPVLDLDAAKPSHVWKGLGVSFAEASCKILSELSAESREKVLRMVFTREGAGLSSCRSSRRRKSSIPISSSSVRCGHRPRG